MEAAMAAVTQTATPSMWSEEELAEVRGRLQEEIEELEADILRHESEIASGDVTQGAGDDQADAGAKTYEREREIALTLNARDLVAQNERAIARIDAGTYGVCESCHKPIGKERLQAFPRATLCVACKQKEERRYPAPPQAGRPRRRLFAVLVTLAAVIYAADLATKTVVLRTLEGEPPLVVIPGVLQFRVIFNSGAAFSIGTGMTFVFTLIAAGVVVAIVRTARKLGSRSWAVTLGLLLGGATGNLTDRLLRYPSGIGRSSQLQGHVVDFIEVLPGNFPVIDYFPVFNIADSAIVCGGILAVFLAWRNVQIDGSREVEKDD
jgi:signal peptidase II